MGYTDERLAKLQARKAKAESLPPETRAKYRREYERICTQVALLEGGDPLLIDTMPEALRPGIKRIHELEREIAGRMVQPERHEDALVELTEMWRGEWRMVLTVCNALPATEMYEQLQLVDGAEVPEGMR